MDPQPFFCEALSTALERTGAGPVWWTTDEVEAERIAGESAPELVLSEIELSDGSGLGLARRIGERTRVVILTRHDEGEALFDAVAAGAAGCVGHGLGVDGLAELVRGHARWSFVVDPLRLRDALRRSLAVRSRAPGRDNLHTLLTAREREVLTMIAAGLDNDGIARRLHLSPHTVRTHAGKILKKLGVHSRADAARVALHATAGEGVDVLHIEGPSLAPE